jgi:hypothetical protein
MAGAGAHVLRPPPPRMRLPPGRRLLQRQDWFTQDKACRVLAQVLAARPVQPFAAGGSDGGAADPAQPVGATGMRPNGQGAYVVLLALVMCFDRDLWGTGNRAQQLPRPRRPPPSRHHCCNHAALPPPSLPPQAVSAFIDWLSNQLRRPTNPTKSVPCAAAALATLLREKGGRTLFTRGGGVQLLSPLLRSCNSPANSQVRATARGRGRLRALATGGFGAALASWSVAPTCTHPP